jgi:hypothetical protein
MFRWQHCKHCLTSQLLSTKLYALHSAPHRDSKHEPLTYTPSSLAPSLPSTSDPAKEYLILPGVPISVSAVDLHLNHSIFPDPHTLDPLSPTRNILREIQVVGEALFGLLGLDQMDIVVV